MLLNKTASATGLRPPGWWVGVGNKAEERRVGDDMAAGRLAWRAAHGRASQGLDALSQGDIETAQLCVWAATDLYIEALEARLRPSELRELGRASQLRGRPRKK